MKKLLLLLAFAFTYMFGAVDLNTASKEELMTLKGVNESKAQAIIDYRQDKKFNKASDIKNVKGVGDKIYNDNKKNMIVKHSAKKSDHKVKKVENKHKKMNKMEK